MASLDRMTGRSIADLTLPMGVANEINPPFNDETNQLFSSTGTFQGEG